MRENAGGDLREALRIALASLATLATLLGVWILAIRLLGLPSQVLPSPSEVGSAMAAGWIGGSFWPHILITLQGALGGFAIGAVLGIAAGIALAEWPTARRIFYPTIIGLQSMPLVAIAPLIVVYLGVGLASKVAMVALLCFFPPFVNTVAGFMAADPRLLDLYRAASATRWRTLVDVKLPGAADHVLAGLQIALVLSFIGCVVAEFVAARAGLGHLIKVYAVDLNVAVMFAGVASLAVLGGGLGYLLAICRRRIVFWGR